MAMVFVRNSGVGMPFKVVSGAGVGAAAVIVGLSLAGPQALGVASADSTDVGSVSVGAADAAAGNQSERAKSSALRSAGRHAATSAVDRTESASKSPNGAAALKVPVGRSRSTAGRSLQPSSAKVSAVIASAAATTRTMDDLSVVSDLIGVADSPDAAASKASSTRVRPDTRFAAKPSLGVPVAVLLDQQVSRAQASVRQFFDVADQWLAGLPANPVTDFLSGALLLVRRNVIPDVAVSSGGGQGFVGWDIVRPSKVEESSYFSNGDEPFVAVLRIVSTTGVAGSTKWQFVTDSPSESGSVKPGQELEINDATGDAWFNGELSVTPLDDAQFFNEDNILEADIMVTVAFVFEGDGGNPADDVKILKQFADPVLKKVADIVENTKIPLSTTTLVDPSATKVAVKKLVDAVKKIKAPAITGEIIGDLVKRFSGATGLDPNDFVGIGTTAFIPTTDALLDTLKSFGIKPSDLGLHNAGEGDGLQEWTNAVNFKYDFVIKNLVGTDGFISGDIWYGFLSNQWVRDWMPVGSFLPWQGEVSYWLKLSAAMR